MKNKENKLAIRVCCRGAVAVGIDDLHPLQGDLKKLSADSHEKLKRSLLKHGFSFPFFAWEHGGKYFILDGHQRDVVLRGLKAEGVLVPPLPVALVDAKNEREAKEKILLISSRYGEITEDELAKFIKDAGLDVDELLETVDLGDFDLEKILNDSPEPAPAPKIDQAAALEKKWHTQAGQLWQIGPHRLMCGDSLQVDDMEKLFRELKSQLIVTSPPYNQKLDQFKPSGMHAEHRWVKNVQSGSYFDSKSEEVYQYEQSSGLNLWARFLTSNGSIFYNHKNRYRGKQVVSPISWITKAGAKIRQEIIWKRPGSVTQNARMFLPCDERIFWLYFGDDFYFDDSTENKSLSSVWEITPHVDREESMHGCAFPIELVRRPMKACSRENDIVFDPYLGSGTTMAAAQQLGRVCYGMEISPAYVAVILERLADMGLTPKLAPERAAVAKRGRKMAAVKRAG